ncbi:MAG: hypothetical protein V4722_09440 [Bacteroidota bacterium]
MFSAFACIWTLISTSDFPDTVCGISVNDGMTTITNASIFT